ncbi:hypothetical protein MIND_00693100 [Mycena indigotica]|uniref:Uncharacterized protein n=1 Tax=Mycena indigotica TaxID=2126181 RepID=A0A8H6SLZ9_9AGAR|nr:uncharacterized protein MIND_00693100 [Mycena indigotica]KAF7301282.1 hypothetical protein MIND_00693100 [Mycena indigotica]
MMSLSFTLLLSVLACSQVFAAPMPALVTVIAPIPGAGQTGTATILGVDQAGHTTFAIAEPVVDGSSTLTVLTATLVAGANFASETFSASFSQPGFAFDAVLGGECTITGDIAVCNDGTETVTTDAAFVTASLTQVLDVAEPTPL